MKHNNCIKVTDEIFQVGGSSLTMPEDAAIYLIHCDNQTALVDSGTGLATDRLIKNIESFGLVPEQITHLFLTHCHYDHTGGAAALRNYLKNCKIFMHVLDAVYLESGDNHTTAATWYDEQITGCLVDEKMDCDYLEIPFGQRNITAHHVPGHSPGSMVYTMHSQGLKVMFGQDVHGPLHPTLKSNRRDYAASLQRMLEMNCDILCEGHYGIIKHQKEVAKFIRSFMSFD
ncbi:MAG: MBL fold metallo-hydrolase [Magnetococcales bacterium]|nr:MBL fold metallo-hydrolase [Magnetococcales bacterium]